MQSCFSRLDPPNDIRSSVSSPITQAKNLTDQVRSIALVTKAVADGDLTKKITVDAKGEILDLKMTVNSMVDSLRQFAAEVTRVAKEVGTDGKLGGQAKVMSVSGEWRSLTDSVNTMSARVSCSEPGARMPRVGCFGRRILTLLWDIRPPSLNQITEQVRSIAIATVRYGYRSDLIPELY